MADIVKQAKIVFTVDDRTASAMAAIDSRFKRLESSIVGFLKSKWTALGAGGAFGFIIKESADAEDSINKARAATEVSGKSWEQWGSKIEAVTKKLQLQTRFSDEALLQSFSQMVSRTGDVSDSLNNLGLVADVAAGLQLDLGTATAIVSRALEGEAGRLGMLLPGLSRQIQALGEHSTAEQRRAVIMERLATLSGRAIRDTQSFYGMVAQLGNIVREVTEVIGGGMLPVLKEWGEKLKAIFTNEDSLAKAKAFGERLATVTSNIVESLVKLGGWVSENGDVVIAFFVALASARIISGISGLAASLSTLGVSLATIGTIGGAGALLGLGVYAGLNPAKGYKAFWSNAFGGAPDTTLTPEIAERIRQDRQYRLAADAAEQASLSSLGAGSFRGVGKDLEILTQNLETGRWEWVKWAGALKTVSSYLGDAGGQVESFSDKLKRLGLVTGDEVNQKMQELQSIVSATTDPILIRQITEQMKKLSEVIDGMNIEKILAIMGRDVPAENMLLGRRGGTAARGEMRTWLSRYNFSELQPREEPEYVDPKAEERLQRILQIGHQITGVFSGAFSLIFSKMTSLANMASLKIKDVFTALLSGLMNVLANMAAQLAASGIMSLLFPSIGFGKFMASMGGIIGTVFNGGAGVSSMQPAPISPYIPTGGNSRGSSFGGGGNVNVVVNVEKFVGHEAYVSEISREIAKQIRRGTSPLAGGQF